MPPSRSITLSLLSLLMACGGEAQTPAKPPPANFGDHDFESQSVSMVALIANPEKYDGSKVLVRGFLNLEFEGDAIYLSRFDITYGVGKNALWVSLDETKLGVKRAQLAEWNGTFVLIEGTVDMTERGHMNSFSGAIRGVSRVQSWGPLR